MDGRVTVTNELVIDAPPDRVWELTTDVAAWPSLTPTMARVELLGEGPLTVGSRARVTQPRLRPATWTVTELEPPHRFVWETEALGTRLVAGHRLEPAGDGCRNRLTLDLRGGTAPVVGRAAAHQLRRALALENDGFRRAAEGLVRPGFVDEHRTRIAVPSGRAWEAVEAYAARLTAEPGRHPVPRLLGTRPVAGFEVAERVPARLLSLAGRHRFSTYVLDFRLQAADGATELSAVTYGDFPGPHGTAYRAAVIGSRGHVLAVRRMLRRIRELA